MAVLGGPQVVVQCLRVRVVPVGELVEAELELEEMEVYVQGNEGVEDLAEEQEEKREEG